MRAVLERLEAGQSIARRDELEAALSPAEMKALCAAGIVRDTGLPDVLELSLADLVRTLRVVYGAEGHGLQAWSQLQSTPMAVGILPEPGGKRTLVLVAGPTHGFDVVTMRTVPTLALAFTADYLTPRRRKENGPGALVEIEVLEEVLCVRGGRIARRDGPVAETTPAHAPSPASTPVLAHARTSEPAPAPRAGPPRALLAGAKTWSEVRIVAEDWNTLRVQHGTTVTRVTAVDLGMAHVQSRKPTRVWAALHAFCDGHGTFRSRRFGGPVATKKTISRLSKDLRALFGLDESPFFPFTAGLGWSTRFVADDRVEEERRKMTPEERAALARAELEADVTDFQDDGGDVDGDYVAGAPRKLRR